MLQAFPAPFVRKANLWCQYSAAKLHDSYLETVCKVSATLWVLQEVQDGRQVARQRWALSRLFDNKNVAEWESGWGFEGSTHKPRAAPSQLAVASADTPCCRLC